MPAFFGMFSALSGSSSVSSARSSFAPVVSALHALGSELASRRDGEDLWVNARIDSELAAQMSRADEPR